jgi:hypothetical protein
MFILKKLLVGARQSATIYAMKKGILTDCFARYYTNRRHGSLLLKSSLQLSQDGLPVGAASP